MEEKEKLQINAKRKKKKKGYKITDWIHQYLRGPQNNKL